MKLHTLFVLLAIILVSGCDKEALTTKPQLKFKSVSTTYVPIGVGLTFTFDFSDKEGDLIDSIGVQKISFSCDDAGYTDTASFKLPDIPRVKNTEGTLEIILDGGIQLNRFQCNGVDTLETAVFRFWLRDAAGNISDTATSPEIQIEKK